MSIVASIIIPTHNRSASLKKILQSLEAQSLPLQNFEVIVVADGCKDDTVEMLKNYTSNLQLSVIELSGLGAAKARNEGASIAKGQYLVFVDDDMELSNGFINEHITSHKSSNDVVIGYSPLRLEPNPTIQRLTLREWWEEKFQAMLDKRYRFGYRDLTSGNFSISSSLFRKTNGFNTTLLCREDYEFGFRLIKAGAQFRFSHEAKAIHLDEVTDVRRSQLRKKTEGIADIQIKQIHPDFINREALYHLSQKSLFKSVLLKLIQFAPDVCNTMAGIGLIILNAAEKMKLRTQWFRLNYRLQQYWYLKGMMEQTQSSKQLHYIISVKKPELKSEEKLIINLKDGLKKAEHDIDKQRPLEIQVYFGDHFIGTLNYEPGFEAYKGVHLRKLLKEQFFDQLSPLITPTIAFANSPEYHSIQ